MITLDDCIALCGLTEAEVLAIAEHEHVPEVVAAALAGLLLRQPGGPEKVRQMIIDDIREANARGDTAHAHQLLCCLKCYLETHAECAGGGQGRTDREQLATLPNGRPVSADRSPHAD